MEDKIKTLIIDDEELSRDTMSELLKLYADNLEVIGQAEDVQSGLKAIKRLKPELVFLDIKMPDGTGFDLLRQIDPINFKIVFITAYEEYAIKAFKFYALDYLLKPIDPDELLQTLDKINKTIETDSINKKFNTFFSYLDSQEKQNEGKKIVLKTQGNIYVVDIRDIICVNSDQNYTRFTLANGESILVSRSIKEYSSVLESHTFYRIHQSYIVNLNHIKYYNKGENCCIMSDGSSVPVSYRKKDELITLFQKL
jgi:two-component system, LytTR family, response regulator